MTVKNRIYTITITINAVDSEGNVATRSAVAGSAGESRESMRHLRKITN